MGRRNRRSAPAGGGGGASDGGATGGFTAPTSGLEDVIFTHGTPRDAAVFEEVVKKITRHLGT